nr:retrovirus-related Pol polyprotein from transposon TNT 1-94 [Tanacetum cinerariifolium]
MTSLADKAILSGADNHPPMLEKDMYDSLKSRMELDMLNRQHGRMILESVESGLLLWPRLPPEVYALVSTHKVAKELWERIQMLMQGTSLTKQERECKLEKLGKLQPKADIGIFIGYAPTKKAFRIYNRRTRRIVETIHVDFDELTTMASEQSSSGPALNEMTPATINSGLVQKSSFSTPYVPPLRND